MEIISNILKRQIVKFIIVGGFCASIEFITFNIFVDFFKIQYLIANVISIVIAVILNYLLSRAFVFQKSKYSQRNEFLSFVFFSVVAILMNQMILWLLFNIAHLDLRICKALAIITVAFFNYLTKKYIVFRT